MTKPDLRIRDKNGDLVPATEPKVSKAPSMKEHIAKHWPLHRQAMKKLK